ncbi:MAG: hypothetical protein E6Q97_29735 [Desulfurellales bacterium]|nr:MAG: hypothetical protein E6Q97_29735 [Desulfurellales bacterium]
MSYVTCAYSKDGERCHRDATTTALDSMYYCAKHADVVDLEIVRRPANPPLWSRPVVIDYTSENYA